MPIYLRPYKLGLAEKFNILFISFRMDSLRNQMSDLTMSNSNSKLDQSFTEQVKKLSISEPPIFNDAQFINQSLDIVTITNLCRKTIRNNSICPLKSKELISILSSLNINRIYISYFFWFIKLNNKELRELHFI